MVTYGTFLLILVKFFQVTAIIVAIYSLNFNFLESYLAPLAIVPKDTGLRNSPPDSTKCVVELELIFALGKSGVVGNV